MTAEQISETNEYVNMIFSELMRYFPAWRQSAVGMSPDEYAHQYKRELRNAFVIAGISDGESIDEGLRLIARKAENGQSFLPPVVEFIKLCKGTSVPYHKEFDHTAIPMDQFSGGLSEEHKQEYFAKWRTWGKEGHAEKERHRLLRVKYRTNRGMQFQNKNRVRVVDYDKGLVYEVRTGKTVVA